MGLAPPRRRAPAAARRVPHVHLARADLHGHRALAARERIRLNGSLDHGPRDTDRVTTEAGLAGVGVEIWSREWAPFAPLLAPPAGAVIRSGRVDFLAAAIAARLPLAPSLPPIDGKSPARALTFVYVGEVDEAAHWHGTRSSEYRDAVGLAGRSSIATPPRSISSRTR